MNSRKLILAGGLFVFTLLCIPALPIILFSTMSAYGEFDEWRYQEPSEFSPKRWLSNPKYRWVAVDLVRNEVLQIGMSEASVASLLGFPDQVDGEGAWVFTAERPGWHLVDFSGGGLLVQFGADKRLAAVVDTRWVD